MKAYLVKYQSKDGQELTKLLIKMTNEMTGEEKWFAGFLNDLPLAKSWGITGTLVSAGDIYWEKPLKDRLINMTNKAKFEETPSIRLTEPIPPLSSPPTMAERISDQINKNKKIKSTKLR